MNVVVKVGSLISQGVYSVATPFHPFGGAVDVIVVQQQDGTFRSTPWYVRFGKFQGVLKGAEKIVKIGVNGVEANFHMYLDNSGEAYFIREVDPGKENETDGILKEENTLDEDGHNQFDDSRREKNGKGYRLEHSVSDSGVSQMRDSYEPLDRLERTDSDGTRRYYDFQDEQSEYGSARFDNLDIEKYGESQLSDSEVVLVSVDGHILTAPVSTSEQDTENVQLSTPQFHLAPGDGTEFCDGNAEFTSVDESWATNYISRVDSFEAKIESNQDCSINNKDGAFDVQIFNDSDEVRGGTELMDGDKEDVSGSCMVEVAKAVGNEKFEEPGSTYEVQYSPEELPCDNFEEDDKTENRGVVEMIKDDNFSLTSGHESSDCHVKNESQGDESLQSTEGSRLVVEHVGSGRISIDSSTDIKEKVEQLSTTAGLDPNESMISESPRANSIEEIQHEDAEMNIEETISVDLATYTNDEQPSTYAAVEVSHDSVVEDGDNKVMESQAETSPDKIQQADSSRFEISLCRDELHPGMGLSAAAEVFDAHRISPEEYKNSATSILESENLVVRFGNKYLPWGKAVPTILGKAAFDIDFPVEQDDLIPVWKEETVKPKDDDTVITPSSSGRRWRLWPIPFRRVKTIEHTTSNSSSEEVFVDSEPGLENSQGETSPSAEISQESPRKQLVRTNIPTSEQIASLNLKDGKNTVTFSFSTRVLGPQQVDAHIYLWKWNARIVISDVDGTITKSDVLGQFMPLVGKDWTQSGVARLFSAIKENGYQLLFLSARAIVQAYLTRSFLLNLKQDGKALPSGPVVISPDGLFPALYREVIRRAPHEFKIACLEDIKKLFPSDHNPFYAGFGNRDTDELSYRKLGIPKGKIFIINPKGEIATGHRIGCKSYTSLHTLVNDMFPPTSLVDQLQEDYNSWNFWKLPLGDIE